MSKSSVLYFGWKRFAELDKIFADLDKVFFVRKTHNLGSYYWGNSMHSNISSKTIRLLTLGAFTWLCTAVASAAIIPAIDYDGSAGSRGDGPFVVGNLFTVGSQSLLLSALGVQDYGDTTVNSSNTNGFVGSPRGVGIWDATGTSLLASVNVASTDPLTGSYRYAAITPILLNANTQYLIGASVGSAREWFGDSGAAASYSGSPGLITLNAARHASSGTLVAPLAVSGLDAGRWGAANMLVETVPEPSTYAIVLLGGALFAFARSRRQHA